MSEQQQEVELSLEEQETEQPEYTDIEKEAISLGWNPDGVEGKRNLTAEEFVDRKPLYDDLHSQQRKIKRLEEGMEALKQHQKVISEREREKAIQELKYAKKQALEAEDFDSVIAIDDKIAETKAAVDPAESTPNVVFENWIEENSWYSQDAELKEYADLIGTAYYAKNPSKSAEAVYDYVAKETKARFPDKFKPSGERERPAPVEGASKGRKPVKSKYSAKDLPEEHIPIMRALVRNRVMTEEEYLKDYFG